MTDKIWALTADLQRIGNPEGRATASSVIIRPHRDNPDETVLFCEYEGNPNSSIYSVEPDATLLIGGFPLDDIDGSAYLDSPEDGPIWIDVKDNKMRLTTERPE